MCYHSASFFWKEKFIDNENSILISIKKVLGPGAEHTYFDPDIILHINSIFSILTQLGIGPEEGFSISGDTEQWSAFIPEHGEKFNLVKSYVYTQVKLIFDPPLSSAVIEAMNRFIKESEWRLASMADLEREKTEEGGT